MDHPVNTNWISRLVYWIIPVTVGLLQALLNIHQRVLPVFPALFDGFVYGIILGLYGLTVWYVVRYNNLEENPLIQVLTSHFVAAVVFTSLWILTSELLVKSVLQNPLYEPYFNNRISAKIIQGLLFYTIIASIYYLYIYLENNKQKRLKEAELLDQLRNAQLNALKSQINPHFLFNSLNSISSLTITNPAKAQQMIIALSGFMRYSLQKNIDEMVSLDTELQNIGLYLQIEKIRFGDKLKYNFEVTEEGRKHLVPNLILQPVFENAIKYGVYEASESVEIFLKAVLTDKGMNITVVNNFDPDAVPVRGHGVGLKNISERLKIIYGSSQLLKVTKEENLFSVSIDIPGENKNSVS